ncbi:DUF2330 domain-containing protein [Plasmodiophora brassicae]|uniref:Uncharacterized protein n=1 Tax=Plasmodiophora brassicae TaxID=37360 RepID=A0A0G4IPK8_PLABS|nr:hypothetical protein PBRA_000609 [Plasmodiophora brassicae]SPQ97569.1 unnamed protein product [Plasmodiophora brassicae]
MPCAHRDALFRITCGIRPLSTMPTGVYRCLAAAFALVLVAVARKDCTDRAQRCADAIGNRLQVDVTERSALNASLLSRGTIAQMRLDVGRFPCEDKRRVAKLIEDAELVLRDKRDVVVHLRPDALTYSQGWDRPACVIARIFPDDTQALVAFVNLLDSPLGRLYSPTDLEFLLIQKSAYFHNLVRRRLIDAIDLDVFLQAYPETFIKSFAIDQDYSIGGCANDLPADLLMRYLAESDPSQQALFFVRFAVSMAEHFRTVDYRRWRLAGMSADDVLSILDAVPSLNLGFYAPGPQRIDADVYLNEEYDAIIRYEQDGISEREWEFVDPMAADDGASPPGWPRPSKRALLAVAATVITPAVALLGASRKRSRAKPAPQRSHRSLSRPLRIAAAAGLAVVVAAVLMRRRRRRRHRVHLIPKQRPEEPRPTSQQR